MNRSAARRRHAMRRLAAPAVALLLAAVAPASLAAAPPTAGVAADAVDLQVSLRRVAPAGVLALDQSAVVEYVIEVLNHGPGDAPLVALEVAALEGLTMLEWTCSVADASCEPSLGVGPVAAEFPLPAGTQATVSLLGRVAPTARFVVIDASLPVVSGPTRLRPEDDQQRLTDAVRVGAMFKDGYEPRATAP